MAFIETNTSLVTNLITFMNRTPNDANFISLIPMFVEWGIQRIKRDLPVTLQVEKYVTNKFSPGVSLVVKPSDWKSNLSFSYGGGNIGYTDIPIERRNLDFKTPLLKKTLDFCYAYWPDKNRLAPPKYYANYGDSAFFICPTPDYEYDFELIYAGLPLSLDDVNQENVFTKQTPRILFFAVVHEAAIYVRNRDLKASSEEEYQKELAAIKVEDQSQITDRQDDVRKG